MTTQGQKDQVQQQIDIAVIKTDISFLKDGQTKQDKKTDIIIDRLDKFTFVKQVEFNDYKNTTEKRLSDIEKQLEEIRPVGKLYRAISSRVTAVIVIAILAIIFGYIGTHLNILLGGQ